MAAIRAFVALLTLAARAHPFMLKTRAADDVSLSLEPQLIGGFNLVITKDDERDIIGHVGRTLLGSFNFENVEDGVSVMVGNVNLTVTPWSDENGDAYGVRMSWKADTNTRLEDCIDFGNKNWYGGPMQFEQHFPIEVSKQSYSAAVTKEEDNGAINERYWLNSVGQYFYVSPQVPLFVDYGNILENHMCFAAQIAPPYSSKRNHTDLTYDIWFHKNVKVAHQHAVEMYLGKPSGLPDFRMVKYPIWSTWSQYSRDINENNLLEYAYQITNNGFENAQFEIDDFWEICYGSLTVNEDKFNNFSQVIREIKSLGFRVSIWVHPFINQGCEPWYSEALSKGFLVLNEEGSPDTSWWNSNETIAAYIDFTNPEAVAWWSGRVQELLKTYNIDSVKFDAGESSWSPQIPVQSGDVDLHPHNIVEAYVRACAQFGDMIEIRTGSRTQDLPVFVRMVDRDSIWGLTNGLSSVITTTLQMNLNGYTFVIADMIGGNGLNLGYETSVDAPTKELFIRWVQANTFLPSMQYSFAPWNFDDETVQICKKYTELHATYAEDIYSAMNASVNNGKPVVAPLWWVDPDDEVTYNIWDEFLLGERILVAPVLEEGAISRDIYLPEGMWFAEGDEERVYEGQQWLYDYAAPLDTLPYFIREQSSVGAASNLSAALVVFIASVLLNFVL